MALGAAPACCQTDWIDILPDATLAGWTRIGLPPTTAPRDYPGWKVDTSARVLICEGDKLGHEWLRYDRELADFDFQLEWRLTKLEGQPRYNSGVYVRNNTDGTLWHQAQVGGASGGWLFADTLVQGQKKRVVLREQMKENRVKPAGEWNQYELRCRGRNLTLSVNGAVTCQFTECEIPRGHLGLEAEGYRIEFRNLRLREVR